VLRCRDIPELASDYLDHQLPVRRRLAMRLHLFICVNCRVYLSQLRQTVGLLHRLPQRPPAPETEDAVLAALHATTRQPPPA
jgi:anti-sigma factor RsiW